MNQARTLASVSSSPAAEGLRVIQAGPLALLQDAGRFGVRHLGVTQGGPVDLHAWAWANALVGNGWGSAALEVTLGGLTLEATKRLNIAVCGADLGVMLEGRPAPLWRTATLMPGQRLCFGAPVSGVRAYLAVTGGFQADPVLDSVSAVVREGLGGHDGQGVALKAGDKLRVAEIDPVTRHRQVPHQEIPDYDQTCELPLIPGAQVGRFSGASLFAAFNQPWKVDDRADRMGVRLRGPRLESDITSMISEGIGLGAVQVPPDGQPIVLLNDRQTIGGYPRLGALTPLGASRLAQCLPGREVRIRPVSHEWALTQARAFRARIDDAR
ncbi:biotin-dependent carboxyltransferase family protein [Halomonas sp. Bachu 37]|uniref:5-oxoprolinase subunit C family protein n=1 Tax=Halomonas kashgarensis TaxID=3084920 RepID=UPI0032172C84